MKPLLLLILLPLFLLAQPATPPTLYAVRLTTGPAWDAAKPPHDQAGMREHSANIARLRRESLLVLGARFGELGLLVLRLPDEAAVQSQLAPDPAIAAGVFKVQIDVFTPFAHGTTAWLTTPEAVLLRAYLEAFNRHDAVAVAAFCAEDFTCYSVDGGQTSTDATSRAQLRDWLVGYFKSFPTVRSEFLSVEQTGPYLTVRERPSWDDKEGKRVSQQAHGVYEIRDNHIRRVWYFPSVKDAPGAASAK
ncbi:SnoaL-like domain protein [Lacunisphaera limnophila]|uniref:SnoaL-like domain protein n=1 Tax=Lacunisphaera limnophila TaxID=1838286 RepID=A0A1D8AXV5_9BACT|nr:nuclear transport factor 2 family protein [Lacunisphaera limnophila]AOS45707.1 SnoaL-like domain protein [Lacunisphaera limnophila]